MRPPPPKWNEKLLALRDQVRSGKINGSATYMTEQVEAVLHDKPDPDKHWENHPGVPKPGTKSRPVILAALRGLTMQEIVQQTGIERKTVGVIIGQGRRQGLPMPNYNNDGTPKSESEKKPESSGAWRKKARLQAGNKNEPPKTASEPNVKFRQKFTLSPDGIKPVPVEYDNVVGVMPILPSAALRILRRKPESEMQAAALFYAAQAIVETMGE